MSVEIFVRSLVIKGWKFWSKDGQLAYRAVKSDDTPKILGQLKDYKSELLSILQARPEILAVGPVSDAQQSYWFQWQTNPNDASVILPYSVRLRSKVDVKKVQHAINAVMARHESLRSIFMFENGELIQQTLPPQGAIVPFEHIYVENQSEAQLMERISFDLKATFQLDENPALRMNLYTLSDREHVLTLSIHHIIIDGLSHSIVLQEFIDNYENLCRGKSVNTAPLDVTFSDFVHWQKQLIGSNKWQQMEEYWTDNLKGAPTRLMLPIRDKSKPPCDVSQAWVSVDLSETLYTRLSAFSKQSGYTKYAILLSTFQALIYHHSAQDDLLIGSPLLGRTNHKFAEVVGFFLNTVVLRAKMSSGQTFSELLAQTSNTTLGAIDNQDYLFTHLLKTLNPVRHPDSTPFFQAMFNLSKYWQFNESNQKLRDKSAMDSGLLMEPLDIGGQDANFDLVMLFEDNNKQLIGKFKFNAEKYDKDLIETMGKDYLIMLDEVMRDPDQVITELNLTGQSLVKQAESVSDGYALSSQQTRIWQHKDQVLNQDILLGLELQGVIDKAVLKSATETVLEQHEIFSTRFANHPLFKNLLQTIENENLRWRPGSKWVDKEGSLTVSEAWKQALNNQPKYDSALPRYEIYLGIVNCSDYSHLLLISVPPMLIDATIASNLPAQILKAYELLSSNSSDIGENPVQYIDIAEWASEFFSSDDARDGKAFWQQLELSKDQIQPLCLDKLGLDIIQFEPAVAASQKMDTQVLRQLLQRSDGVTPEAWLFTAWQIYLNRLVENAIHLIGKRFDGRPDDDIATVVGPLARFLPIPSHIENDQNIWQVLDATNSFLGEAETWQECFQWPKSEEHSSRLNALPYLFEFDENESQWQKSGFHAKLMPFAVHSEPFNLKLSCSYDSRNNALDLTLFFNSKAFDASVAEVMLGQFSHVLAQMLNNPEQSVLHLELLSKEEKLHTNAQSDQTVSYDIKLIHQRIREAAAQYANKPAIRCQDEQYTYSQLNQITVFYANKLVEAGVKPGDFVGVYVRHSNESVVAMLAILNAGAIYVPLDPEYPADRLAYIIEDCALKIVLVAAENDNVVFSDGVETITLNASQAHQKVAKTTPVDYPLVEISKDDIAYLIYTSGSTGQPKGTLVSHAALADHCASIALRFNTKADDIMLLFAPLNFDPSIEQVLVPLMVGATVHVKEPGLWQPSEIAEKVRDYGLTIVNFPTAFWHLLVGEWQRQLDRQDIATLKMVIVGGDKLQPEILNRWWRLDISQVRLLNAYGPTEATITTTTADLSHKRELDYGQLTIGTPLNNRKLYILDAAGKRLPVGALGELYIGGKSLANGYLNRPDLTEKVFLTDPFDTCETSKLYRTGDRAYFDDNGEFYFVGRQDSQVKISGYRIELMEIERTVLQLEAVQDAAVIVTQSSEDADNKQIVVCFVARSSNTMATNISEYLAKKMPVFMMPHGYVQLEQMPLNPSGKIDRKQLAKVAIDKQATQDALDPPASKTEIALAEIWRSILNIEQINRQDSFTLLGGHSLLYLKLLSIIGEQFGINLKLKDVFEANELSKLAELIDNGMAGEDETLQQLPLVPADRSQPLPLSFAQESMWLLSQLGHGMSYQMAGVMKFSKALNVDSLKQCMAVIANRHEVLRTRFVQTEQGAIQEVVDSVCIPFDIVENTKPDDQQAILDHWRQYEMDLTQAPLMRVILIRSEYGGDRLGVSLHHIISDGLSVGILLREVASLYDGLAKGETLELPALTIQYPDFAAWQRKAFDESSFKDDLEYWKLNLAGYQNMDVMPRQSRPQELSGEGRRISHTFAPELDKRISALTGHLGISKASFLVTAVHLLLSSYSQNKDFCIGMPTANRNRAELESMVGMLVNILVVRLGEIDSDTSTHQLLKHTNDVIKNGMAHQEIPFEKLVESLNPIRDASRNPLFQVFFSFMQFDSVLEFAGEEVVFESAQGNQSRFDLAFDFLGGIRGLNLDLEYSTELFTDNFISQMLDNLTWLLEQLSTIRNTVVQSLEFLAPQQAQEQILWGLGEKLPEVNPQESNVIDLILQQTKMRPHAPALTCGNCSLSYGEFANKVAKIAARLTSHGVKAGDFVGVSVRRGLYTSLNMIAVMRLGAVYVPVDPTLPAKRIDYIFKDSNTEVVLTDEYSIAALQNAVPQGVQWILQDGQHEDAISVLDVEYEKLDAEKPAYVIYTSGSSGKPKGVIINLASVTHCIHAMAKLTGFGSKDKTLAVATTSFDISVLDLLMPLSVGGELLIADDESVKDPQAMANLLVEHKVTYMQATPTTFEMMFSVGWTNHTKVQLLSIGEPVTAKLQRSFEQHNCRVWNGYGPTETTIYATAKELVPGCQISIGRAIGNYKVYILNEQLKPVPTGVPGELHIGGPAVGLGYHNKPDLTNKVFLDNPFSAGEKIYRTGDLTRWIEQDGEMEIEYISRIDQQVKLRGYRIELGEIEAALDSQNLFDSVAVVLKTTPTGEQLVAYALPKKAQDKPDKADIRTQLSALLPGYMVPSYIEFLDEMPMTASNKLDKKHLKNLPVVLESSAKISDVSPVTEKERELLAIWQQLFSSQQIAVTDNFFALGGHSLLLIQLQNQLQKKYDVNLTLASLFKAPVLRQMAEMIQHAAVDRESRIKPAETPENVGLSFNQQGLWLVDNMAGGTSAYNIICSFKLEGHVRPDLLLVAWQMVQKRQLSLRTYFEIVKGQVIQKVRDEVLQSLTVTDLSKIESFKQQTVINTYVDIEFSHVFNLKEDTLFRLRMFKCDTAEYIVVLNLHHITMDGWSVRLLLNEIMACYESLLNDKPLQLPTLPVSYADFSHWQRQAVNDNRFAEQFKYWKAKMANCPKQSALPFDSPFTEKNNFNGVALDASFTVSELQPLQELASRLDTTLFTVMLSGWNVLLYLETGETDIQIGTDVANRTMPETESVIGLFMNQVPLRTQVKPFQSIEQLVKSVSQTCIDAFANQEVPFEQLVSALGIERQNGVAPLFQSKFFMDHLANDLLVTESFKIIPMAIEQEAARLPLNFSLTDTGEGITGKLVYDTNRFKHTTVERMLTRYHTLLTQLTKAPAMSVQSICDEVLDGELELQDLARQSLREAKLKPFKSKPRRRSELN
ncbi:amino acid adenylation domain-containing protein [Rheinheimera pacifica]|uniref:Amino acid adenylation domain-containing protein n=1 Tax=Rheinheimera pacifica TaxID=173990 RepID=A0A1H6MU66_9GAMM|nr:non-ribosomal peptide synthetase [Rheinheimera pacifica]SEI05603.1 amino acid adenylation domain-containing protein [Rheinheimera pacifica]